MHYGSMIQEKYMKQEWEGNFASNDSILSNGVLVTLSDKDD